jgi:hypothetical protein
MSRSNSVFEAGFSEDSQDLAEDARLWLEGQPSVNMVALGQGPGIFCIQNFNTRHEEKHGCN